MEELDEPDDRFYETSYSRNGFYDQFILFIMDAGGIEYAPVPEKKPYDNPETTEGGW